MDLGPPSSYLVLEKGLPVYDGNGEQVGVVEHVLADYSLDIFDGLIIQTTPLVGRHLFADTDQIAELHERGVLLSVDRDALHEPGARPAAERAGSIDRLENSVQARLERAREWLDRRR